MTFLEEGVGGEVHAVLANTIAEDYFASGKRFRVRDRFRLNMNQRRYLAGIKVSQGKALKPGLFPDWARAVTHWQSSQRIAFVTIRARGRRNVSSNKFLQ